MGTKAGNPLAQISEEGPVRECPRKDPGLTSEESLIPVALWQIHQLQLLLLVTSPSTLLSLCPLTLSLVIKIEELSLS